MAHKRTDTIDRLARAGGYVAVRCPCGHGARFSAMELGMLVKGDPRIEAIRFRCRCGRVSRGEIDWAGLMEARRKCDAKSYRLRHEFVLARGL